MHIITKLGAVLALTSLAACATPVQHATASGKVEETFKLPPDQVKPKIVSMMVNWGYNITKDTPYLVAFDKPVQNVMASVLLGSRYDATPNARISYTFAQIGEDTRVVADFEIVTNPGSAFERLNEANGNPDTMKVQRWLDIMAQTGAIPDASDMQAAK